MMMWSYLLMTAGCCYLYDDHFMSIIANMIPYQSSLLVGRVSAAGTHFSQESSFVAIPNSEDFLIQQNVIGVARKVYVKNCVNISTKHKTLSAKL